MPVVRTDGRSVGRSLGRSVTWLPNFLEWVDFLSYGVPPTRARSARVELRYKFCPIVAQTMIKNSQNVVKNTTTFKRSIHFFLFLTDSCCERNLRHWILSLSSATVWLDHYISAGFMVLIQPCKTTWHELKRTFPFFHCLEYVNISSEGKRRSLRWNRMIAWV